MARQNDPKLLRAFASNLKRWRSYHELTLQQLAANEPNPGQELLQRLERGMELPDYRTLMRLCQMLNVAPEQLLPPGIQLGDLDELAPTADPENDPLLQLHQAQAIAAARASDARAEAEKASPTPDTEDLNPLFANNPRTTRHHHAMQRAHRALENIGARLSERGAEALDVVLNEIISLIEPVGPDAAPNTSPAQKKRTL
jgi:transcriptional regulator with XRE-family HTH domain